MLRISLAMLLVAMLGVACTSSRASPPGHQYEPTKIATIDSPQATVVPVQTEAPSPTLIPPATLTPSEPAATPTVATPTRFSEVLGTVLPPPVTQKPVSPTVRGGTLLPLPNGTSVVWGGCSSDGQCNWFNFYWAPTREVVMQNGESQLKVQHELCHAHQHWAINGGAPLDPVDYNLAPWYSTEEGVSYASATEGLAWPWSHSAVNGLEDFAWTCAHWYLQPGHLLKVSPERYAWAAAHLP